MTSILMALLVLLSTLSITIDKHYCADKLVDVALYSKAKGCCPAAVPAESMASEEGCCKNETDLLVGQDELSLHRSELTPEAQKVFIISLAYVFYGLHSFRVQKDIPFDEYSPPKLSKDLQLLHEVYLI
jgi:hypothetical protein